MTANEIVKQLQLYSEKYYRGEAIISDEAFDALEDELRRQDPTNPYFSANRETANGYGTKHNHIYSFIGSIDKIHSMTESRLNNNGPLYLSAKLDGTSMVAYYEDGKLVHALTRGDGYTGLDVTQHYLAITNKYRIALPKDFTGAVRGEVIFSKLNWEMFKSIHPEAKMPRNSGTGLVNQKTVQPEATLLDYVTYDIVASNYWPDNIFTTLSGWGFYVAPNIQLSTSTNVTEDVLQNLFDEWGKIYPLDGIVIRDAQTSKQDTIDGANTFKLRQEAFKFQAETKVCTVTSVTWDLGRTGKLIPVIQIEPTELSGAVVTNVTGHNAKNIQDSQIGVGSEITVRRSGEVIPYLDTVITPKAPVIPTTCPYCGEPLTWSQTGVDLICTNDDCSGQNFKKISNYILNMCKGIKGIGDSFLDGFITHFKATDILDLVIKLSAHDITSTILTLGNADNEIARKAILALTQPTLSLSNFLQALGIKFLGGSFSQELANSQHTTALLSALAYGDAQLVGKLILEILPGRAVLADVVSQNTAKISAIIDVLYSNGQSFDISYKTAPTSAQLRYYAVTGSLSKPRKEFEAELLSKGWKMTETISKAEFLINNDNTSASSKNQKAIAAGKPILTEQQFREEHLN